MGDGDGDGVLAVVAITMTAVDDELPGSRAGRDNARAGLAIAPVNRAMAVDARIEAALAGATAVDQLRAPAISGRAVSRVLNRLGDTP